MSCPESEILAAHADGTLEPDEAARLLEHAADCDGCRRELALLELSRAGAGAGLPARARAKALKTALRPSRSFRSFARSGAPRPAFAFAAAAAVLFAALVLAVALRKETRVVAPPRAPVVREEPAPLPSPEAPRAEAPAVAKAAPPVVEEPARPPSPPPPLPREEPPSSTPEAAPEPPKAGETRVQPPAPPTHTVAARVLSEVQLTDFSGAVVIRRKGSSAKERPGGMARLAEGDVLASEKGAAGFRVAGVHPVVLGENTSVSMAWAAQDQAPWMHVRAGEVTVDSTGPTRWIVSDGSVAVVLKQAQARFAAAPGQGLRISALSEPLYAQPDGGAVHALRPGEELEVARGAVERRPIEAGRAERLLAAFGAARPRQRTIFFTSCDPADAKREHFFLQEGSFLKNEALLSKDRPDRSMAVSLAPNPRFTWRDGLVLRARLRTNAQLVTATLRCEERRYTLFKELAVDRKSFHTWISVEIPLPVVEGAMGFRRDDGMNQLTFTFDDKYDVLRFEAKAKDVFGDQKGYLLVDDLQVVVKD